MRADPHPFEHERLQELDRQEILDTEVDRSFDDITDLAATLCGTPAAAISFVDRDRQWFKSEVGMRMRQSAREVSICSHAILEGGFVEIPDTATDRRTQDNPLCEGATGFRFYAGVVLNGTGGLPLGTLCVLDRVPRTLNETQKQLLNALARNVMNELELRAAVRREQLLRREVDHRAKNSLAAMAAIVSLKANRAPTLAVRTALNDVALRIGALAALHAELHKSGSSTVDLSALFERATEEMGNLLPEGIRVIASVSADPSPAVFANSLLMIAHEFAVNSARHGFGEAGGDIAITVRMRGRKWIMVCRDSGRASVADAEKAASGAGLGTQVIQSIARSINAKVKWRSMEPGMELEMVGGFTA